MGPTEESLRVRALRIHVIRFDGEDQEQRVTSQSVGQTAPRTDTERPPELHIDLANRHQLVTSRRPHTVLKRVTRTCQGDVDHDHHAESVIYKQTVRIPVSPIDKDRAIGAMTGFPVKSRCEIESVLFTSSESKDARFLVTRSRTTPGPRRGQRRRRVGRSGAGGCCRPPAPALAM